MDGGFSQELRYKNRQMCGEEWGGGGEGIILLDFLSKIHFVGWCFTIVHLIFKWTSALAFG